MPQKLDRELASLKDRLASMSTTAQNMFQRVLRALVDRDASLLEGLKEQEESTDRSQIEIDREVVRMMAVYGPVALDLRFVLMVARINSELERIGDMAVNMYENARLLLAEPELKKLVDLPRMANAAAGMLKKSMEAFRTGSTQLAKEVIEADGEVDALQEQIFRELLIYMMTDASAIPRAVALIFICRALERIADHAVNIAEEVVFLVKGEDIRHEEAQEHRARL